MAEETIESIRQERDEAYQAYFMLRFLATASEGLREHYKEATERLSERRKFTDEQLYQLIALVKSRTLQEFTPRMILREVRLHLDHCTYQNEIASPDSAGASE